ncbi:hypothetical protein [Pseudomonas sp. OV226]|uniref:hypothetical protein n=1 Tax=Pseudomonas sp. OV226 TaxID=2135588 RepID=UPI000D6D9F34|nr:hypothetical protein [Pseudomonas sp. OV226]PWK32569.1 hypothetical protein C7534_120119 [Pseudomonas sp. OV226]
MNKTYSTAGNRAKPRVKPTELRAILDGLPDKPEIKRQIERLANQLLVAGREITATDARQLRDIAELELRALETRQIADALKAEGDLKGWASALKALDGYTALKRGLLRDLKLTRITAVVTTAPASERKQDSKSARGWEGVL